MQVERRANITVREVFEEAYTVALPFIDPDQGVGGKALTRHAFIVLHERFPDISTQNMSILVHAIERTFVVRTRTNAS